jgi:antitoxin component YwqK of YwqJK toxin-antitoxin module
MLKVICLILGLFLVAVCCEAQEFTNLYDSHGYKQGRWIEYKAVPSSIVVNGKEIYSADSSIVYSDDLYLYEGECIFEKQVGEYKNSLREGLWKLYFPEGILFGQINYYCGIPLGEIVLYYSNGNVALKGEISYDLHTKWETYDEEGKLLQSLEGSAKEIVGVVDR